RDASIRCPFSYGLTGIMDAMTQDLATRVYLEIDLECEVCQRRFGPAMTDAPFGSERAIRKWADAMAIAAIEAGWRIHDDRILCAECLQKHTEETRR
ncbi:MAG: hypothetical protein ACK4UN_18855, partial [Limisphaerales bacterium]